MARMARPIVGEWFGDLQAKEFVGKRGQQKIFRCQCRCGEWRNVAYAVLVNKRSENLACKTCVANRKENLVGRKFHRLTVDRFVSVRRDRCRMWACTCRGPNGHIGSIVVSTHDLKREAVRSCGCYHVEMVKKANITHGRTKTKEYRAWTQMRARCYSKSNPDYPTWGGKGVQVCESWNGSFEQFFADMGECPEGRSLHRKNSNGNYEPDNCIWATDAIQKSEKRNAIYLTHNGQTKTLSSWAKTVGLTNGCIRIRIYELGWTIDKALSTPANQPRTKARVNRTPAAEEKRKARQAVHAAIKRGTLLRPSHCQYSGCCNTKVQAHHHAGYSPENATNVLWFCGKHHPSEKSKTLKAFGVEKTVQMWAIETSVTARLIYRRLKSGWTPEDAVSIGMGQRKGKVGRRKRQ